MHACMHAYIHTYLHTYMNEEHGFKLDTSPQKARIFAKHKHSKHLAKTAKN